MDVEQSRRSQEAEALMQKHVEQRECLPMARA